MADKTVSEAVRYLERMRDEGFLSEKQFRMEVRDLLRRREDEGWEPPEGEDEESSLVSSVLADMVGHSRPVEFDEEDISSTDMPSISGLVLELEDPHDERPEAPAYQPHHLAPPAPTALPKEAGRVIVKGKAPWDDQGSERVDVDGHKKLKKEEHKTEISSVHKPLNPVMREKLARMAERTNKVLNRRRSPEVAFGLSLAVPGLGHVYFGNLGVGMALMLLAGAGWVGAFFEEYWVLYILAPMGLLSGALIHRKVQLHNNYVDMKLAAEARRAPVESSLNVEKSIRSAGAKAANSGR